MTQLTRRSWLAGLLALIGGGAIIASSALTWLDVGTGVSVGSVSISGTPTGSELLLGQVALGAGIAVVILGLLLLAIRRARRLLGLLVIVAGITAIAAGAFVASSPLDRYIDYAVQKGAPAGQSDEVRASLTNLFAVSSQDAELGVGLYVVIGGGALSVIGGLTAVFGRRKPKRIEEAKEPWEQEPEGLPEEWLAARAAEAEARSAPVEEPPQQVLVAEPAGPPLPDPPPWPEEAAPLPEPPESPPPEEEPARAEEGIEAPTEAAEEPAPTPEPVAETVAPSEPPAEPVKPDVRANWSKPLPDDWVAKPAKRRFRRRS